MRFSLFQRPFVRINLYTHEQIYCIYRMIHKYCTYVHTTADTYEQVVQASARAPPSAKT